MLGTIFAKKAKIDGKILQRLEYTPYGSTAVEESSGSAASGVTHKFTGKELDETGLYYYGARYYDPTLGKFITPDTIVQSPFDPQTLNRYTYCRSNPVKYTDPSGHFFWFAAAIIIGAIMGGISAAINGQSIGMGILMGAVGGALVAAGAAGAVGLWGASWGCVGAAVGGAISGAANAAVFGGNIGQGALVGAIGAGVGYGIGYNVGKVAGDFWGSMAGGLGGGALAGGVGAELSGGDFGRGALQGGAYGLVGAMAGYGASKAFSGKTTQQLETDEKPDVNYDAEGQPKSFDLANDSQNVINKSGDRFFNKAPGGSVDFRVQSLPDGSKIFSYETPARNIPGSKAIYQKTVDASGQTTRVVQLIYDKSGNLIITDTKYVHPDK